MDITMYWKNKENELETVEVQCYLNSTHEKCVVKRYDGGCIAVPTKDLIVITDIDRI